MTRTEYIDLITARLASLDEKALAAFARLAADADHVAALAGLLPEDDQPLRPLTPRELALLERSKEDFRAGRIFTSAEVRASLDDDLARLGVPRSTS